MKQPKKHAHATAIHGAIRDYPHLSMRYSADKTRAFIYYKAEMKPFMIAERLERGGFKVGKRYFITIGEVLKHADQMRAVEA